jgi:hypothetical protein
MHATKKRIFAPKGQKTLFSFINHEKDSNNNNARSHIDMEIGDDFNSNQLIRYLWTKSVLRVVVRI